MTIDINQCIITFTGFYGLFRYCMKNYFGFGLFAFNEMLIFKQMSVLPYPADTEREIADIFAHILFCLYTFFFKKPSNNTFVLSQCKYINSSCLQNSLKFCVVTIRVFPTIVMQ